MEEIIKGYLDDIRNNFPQLTDHSLDHSRMLWNYANIIIGDRKFYLNPLEGFVLHAVFLIHDSGMCFSILNNKEEIENDRIYQDYLTEYGDNEENRNEALFYTIRIRHGDYALRVATEKLKHGEYLVNDTILREELSLIIGKIAKSHTCHINYIERELDYIYISPNYSVDWKIDCSKLAFILRTSDAAHLDNLRTPKTLKLISELGEVSRNHWIFQKKLGFPILSEDNTLIYNTNSPFSQNQQKAWWYCYNAFKVLDDELKKANEYFELNGKTPFSARGVKSINDTLLIGEKYVRTKGWVAFDTQVKVSNPVHIASELGGVKLYGQISFALRELIQNSIDAINIHRIFTGQNNENLGEIKVSLEEEDNHICLIVTDNGIGMSQTLLCNEILDFGGSYWRSNRFGFEFEGIKTKGFQSIGKFGVGFFSIFMLGQKITVTSWKFGEGIEKMKTLDFYDGLFSSPVLRDSNEEERKRILDRGTTIKVKLALPPNDENGIIGKHRFVDNRLFTLVKYYIPGCNVKISVKELNGDIRTIEPNYPYNLKLDKLIDFFYIPTIGNDYNSFIQQIKELKIELTDIIDNDRNYGKLAILPSNWGNYLNSTALVLSKGIKVNELRGFIGYIIVDEIISIKRDVFSKIVPFETLKKWAIIQIKYIENNQLVGLYINSYLSLLLTFGFYKDDLPIALKKTNNIYKNVSVKELKLFLKSNNEVNFYMEGYSNSIKSPNCDGFIFLSLNLAFNNIVKEIDQSKLLTYNNKLKGIFDEIWKNYVFNDNRFEGIGMLNSPYSLIRNYKKVIS
ncbi:ATP-binding protein [Mariniflexile gromovii]|uniref:ATP-binding protein n=1 Tax=Mariniflexile gromovii TaxID=362523 RepID=A0ABS4BYD1_9FLAO|nr:ATP-binding protein [Mariniflexile gromovii]MBP0905588.1 ATP-binding protein [Mariniflexile gromovii]